MNWFQQLFALIGFNVRSLPQRLGSSFTAAAGIAGVVLVMVGVLSIARGFERTMTSTTSPDVALVLRSGSNDELSSGLGREETRLISEKPGVRSGPNGPLASAELFVVVDVPRKNTLTDANVPLRGVEPAAFEVRPNLAIVEGRAFAWGRNEVIVGRGAQQAFAGLEVGQTLSWGNTTWTVAGVFEDGGGVAESEIWTDAKVLQPAYNRGDSFQSVLVRLDSPASFQTFADALSTDPQLEVRTLLQQEYLAAQSQALVTLISVLGYVVAAAMGLGAVFGALNTMYSAIAARTREIATLRALGFGGAVVATSVLAESTVIALVGGAGGAAGAYLAFDGLQTATMNFSTFSQVAFAFAVTPGLLLQGLVFALLIGLVGGFFPALRAVRMPIATALREL